MMGFLYALLRASRSFFKAPVCHHGINLFAIHQSNAVGPVPNHHCLLVLASSVMQKGLTACTHSTCLSSNAYLFMTAMPKLKWLVVWWELLASTLCRFGHALNRTWCLRTALFPLKNALSTSLASMWWAWSSVALILQVFWCRWYGACTLWSLLP